MSLAKFSFPFFLLLSLPLIGSVNLKPPKTKRKKINCSRVFLSKDTEAEIKSNTFTYGETFYVVFDDIEGFEVVEGKVAPRMLINIYDSKNKEVFSSKGNEDLQEQTVDDFVLYSYISLANPIHSNQTYRIKIKITDKNGPGFIKHEFSIKLLQDKKITQEKGGLKYREAYLFSGTTGKVIATHKATFNEQVYLIIEGIEGLYEKNDLVNIGVDIRLEDENGNIIIEQHDLFKEAVSVAAVKEQFAVHFTVTESENRKVKTNCTLLIYDKSNKDKFLALTTKILFLAPEEE